MIYKTLHSFYKIADIYGKRQYINAKKGSFAYKAPCLFAKKADFFYRAARISYKSLYLFTKTEETIYKSVLTVLSLPDGPPENRPLHHLHLLSILAVRVPFLIAIPRNNFLNLSVKYINPKKGG